MVFWYVLWQAGLGTGGSLIKLFSTFKLDHFIAWGLFHLYGFI